MTDYPLEALGPHGFQDLVQALLIDVGGAKISPMGRGRDGGRDVITSDDLPWPEGDDAPLHGYSVFQIKHSASLLKGKDAVDWLWSSIRSELNDWVKTGKDERSRLPDTLIFVTNVSLTPYPGSGGWDTIQDNLSKYREALKERARKSRSRGSALKTASARMASITSVRVLAREWVIPALNKSASVRRAFPALLTAPDVIAELLQMTNALSLEGTTEALKAHARKSLTVDGTVWMAEAGDAKVPRMPLHELLVDVPVLTEQGEDRERDFAIRLLLDRAGRMLRPGLRATDSVRHLVLTGAPGNGKTTLAKFLVQAFRVSLLKDGTLSTGQRDVKDGTIHALERIGVELPRHQRWPLRIDLKDMLQRGLLLDGTTLLGAIARYISTELDEGDIRAATLDGWRRQWPWLLMVDGFDEVTDPDSRRVVIERLEQFIEESEQADADVLVVVTTRALGYNDEFSDVLFDRVDLDYFSNEEALAYASRIVSSRLEGDEQRQKKVLELVNDASHNAGQQALLRTPLQVLVLVVIVDGSQRLEPDRYGLFAAFFELAFRRELSKGGRLEVVLDQLQPVIRALHRRVGFELQVRSEHLGTPDPVLPMRELEDMIWQELEREGFKPGGRHRHLTDEVYKTATQRLVLLTPHDEGFGFEIRSLQEFSASEWITAADDATVLRRISLAAASPHWRNTILFAAGSIFRGGNARLQALLVRLVEEIDSKANPLAAILPIAPSLAIEMLDDGMVRNRPWAQERLFAVALRALRSPTAVSITSDGARAFRRLVENGGEEFELLVATLRAGAREGWLDARNAEHLMGNRRDVGLQSGRVHLDRLGFEVKHALGSALMRPAADWVAFENSIGNEVARRTDEEAGPLTDAASAIGVARSVRIENQNFNIDDIVDALSRPGTARPVAEAVAALGVIPTSLRGLLWHAVMPVVWRARVGHVIRETGEEKAD